MSKKENHMHSNCEESLTVGTAVTRLCTTMVNGENYIFFSMNINLNFECQNSTQNPLHQESMECCMLGIME